MAVDDSVKLPQRGPATFSGAFGRRTVSAPTPAPRKGKKAAKVEEPKVEEEEEDDDDEPMAQEAAAELVEKRDQSSGEKKFVFDAAKGCLVEVAVDEAEEGSKEGAAPDKPQTDKADGEEEHSTADDESDDEAEGGEVDADTSSRLAFLNEASTPELIKQAVSVGGALAASVLNKWVLDKATELYFRPDSESGQMHCWNPSQSYMYLWKGRGRLEFVWTSSGGAGRVPAGVPLPPGVSGTVAAADASPQQQTSSEKAEGAAVEETQPGATPTPAADSNPAALWVTVIPPSMLAENGLVNPNTIKTEEVEVPSRALVHIVGKNGASIKELEAHSGAKASIKPREEGENHAHVVLEGSRDQILSAKQVLEQKLVLAIGEKKAESLVKHQMSTLMDKLKNETGEDAAVGGIEGMKEFAAKWKLKAVLVRKLRKLDAMLQKYMIKHFKPWKSKPENALRSYVTTLMMHPQRWRLDGLHDQGELDGDVCETAVVSQSGALVGLQRSAVADILGDNTEFGSSDEQMIELEVDSALGAKANRVFGDVQPEHCRLMTLGTDFYAMALDSKIGTVIDGKKYRQEDGPVAIRDGSTLNVGKYVLYCEVGKPEVLQDRRVRLQAGENFWKITKGGSSASTKAVVAVAPAAASGEKEIAPTETPDAGVDAGDAVEASGTGSEEMAAGMDALSKMIDDGEEDDADDAVGAAAAIAASGTVGLEEIDEDEVLDSKEFEVSKGTKRKHEQSDSAAEPPDKAAKADSEAKA